MTVDANEPREVVCAVTFPVINFRSLPSHPRCARRSKFAHHFVGCFVQLFFIINSVILCVRVAFKKFLPLPRRIYTAMTAYSPALSLHCLRWKDRLAVECRDFTELRQGAGIRRAEARRTKKTNKKKKQGKNDFPREIIT